ncbi:MAG: recombination regulator RecX [Ruminococcus bromii]|nr:recombination regulator RecX [Ruminococcus bromii]MDD6433024.1 regulatory protein RecX [Ruminococcus bromii]MDY4085083.1 regulatory protein RecX [Ruminococcus bromii]MDY4710685.1 regulatory protein RecX [Ruminococcus bromii]MEE0965358.1 regulatory protein RecX [Ruminococcus bromii]
MLITAIEPRRKAMSALYLDGEYVMNLDTRTLIENRFDVGKDIDDEDLHEIIRLSNERRAKEKALWLISYRDHSKKELADKIKRTCDEESADKAVERMEELGLVNDESYALHYAQKLIFTKHMSKNAVVYELARKGIDKELAAEILDEIEVDSSEQIRIIIDKKYKNISDEKIRRRAVAALQRLGYRWDEIKGVIEEYAEDDSI